MTGLRPIAEIMFSDFLAVCWDIVANEIAKTRYMTNGQITLPLVIRTANGAGSRFGAQHSQAVENWAMAIPGLKVVAPSIPGGREGAARGGGARSRPGALLRAEVALFDEGRGARRRARGRARQGEGAARRQGLHDRRARRDGARGRWTRRRSWRRSTASRAPSSTCARWCRSTRRRYCRRSSKTGRLVTVEENPRLCGWGAEIASIVADECFWDLDGPIVRITTPHIPLPSADELEDHGSRRSSGSCGRSGRRSIERNHESRIIRHAVRESEEAYQWT